MKKYTVEFTRPTYQYITINAGSESEAIRQATAMLDDKKWDDYGNYPTPTILETDGVWP